MKFVYYFYILVLFLIEQRIWKVRGSADFNGLELEHLSKKLHPRECMKLLEAMYLRTPAYEVKDDKEETGASQLNNENCRHKLEEWNRVFPGKENKRARGSMAKVLRSIGRSDLANYIKRSKRLVQLLNNYVRPGDVGWSNRDKDVIKQPESLQKMKKKKRKPQKEAFSDAEQYSQSVGLDENYNRETRADSKKNKLTELKLETTKKPTAAAKTGGEDSKGVTRSFLEQISTTFWIAFLIFLMLVIFSIIVTGAVILCRNRHKIWGDSGRTQRGCDDRCRLIQHLDQSPDIESGLLTPTPPSSPSPASRRSSSMSSYRWSSIGTPVMKKLRKVSKKHDKQQQTSRVEKKKKTKRSKEEKPKEKKVKEIKKPKTKERKKSKDKPEVKQDQVNVREQISAVLVPHPHDCRCCTCIECDGKHKLCSDDRCREQMIHNLGAIYPNQRRSSTKSPRPSKDNDKKKKVKEKRERRSTAESSPRERKESRFMQAISMRKDKSPRSSLVEPCTNTTCDMRKSSRERSIDSSPSVSGRKKSL